MKVLCLLTLSMWLMSAVAAEPSRLHVPGITGQDNRIINELRTPPWSAIGRLNITTGGFCTASVVGPRQVLTAAHCLWNKRTARWYPPCALHFLAGYQRGEYAVHALVAEIHIADGYRTGDGRRRAGRDWAIVTLDRDVAKQTGVLDLVNSAPQPGDAIAQAGYSRDRPHVLTVDRACSVRASAASQSLLLHDCDATFGDSGSPILHRSGDTYRIVGMHTALRGRGRKTLGVAVSARAFADWLTQHPVTRPPGGVKACSAWPGERSAPPVQWTDIDPELVADTRCTCPIPRTPT